MVVFALVLTACSQNENESCQVQGDCDVGLICVRARSSERGTCKDPSRIKDAGPDDAGDLPDALPLPAIDAEVEVKDDAGASDAALGDAALGDAALGDAALGDAALGDPDAG